MGVKFWMIAAAGIIAALVLSYGFAHLGHPESAWFWCDMARLCGGY